jgi:Protein of unknown function (DUF3619)
MNQNTLSSAFVPRASAAGNAVTPPAALDALQARFALRITAALTERSREIAPDVAERLRFARETALERARAARSAQTSPAVGVTRAGAAILAKTGPRWWVRIASVVPVFALVGGLVLIQRWQDNAQISVAAEVDAALLSDDLPPTAYSDAGFAEFLKTPSE